MMSFGESGCIFLQGGVMGPFHPSKILLWKHCGCVEFSAPGFDALKSFGCICLQWGVLPTGGCIRNLQFCPSSLPLFLTSENLEAFSIKFLVLAWKSFHFKANGCWLPFTSISIKFGERLQERGAITQLIRRLTLTLSPPESLLTSTSMLMTFGLNIENGLHYFEQSEIWKSIGNNSYLLWDNLKARDSSAFKNTL